MVEALEGQKIVEAEGKEMRSMLQEANKYRGHNPSKTQLILRAVCDKFGIELPEAVRRMEKV